MPTLLELDQNLSNEDRDFVEKIRIYFDTHFRPFVEEWYFQRKFPNVIVEKFKSLGLFGIDLPHISENPLTTFQYGLLMREIEKIDSGLRSFLSVHCSLALTAIATFGSKEAKEYWIPDMLQGDKIGSFALTESTAGSNPAGMTTNLAKIKSQFLLNGKKRWVTNGPIADLCVVWCKNENQKISGVIVDLKSDGVTIKPIDNKHSLNISMSSEIEFNDVLVKPTDVLEVASLKGPFTCLNKARFGIAWGAIGASRDCLNTTIEYANNRNQFGIPLSQFQLVQAKLANMGTQIELAELLCHELTKYKNQDRLKPHQISMAKMNNVSMALNCARTCRDILGANGILSNYPVMRHMMNLETVNTYEGTEDIHRLVIGQYLTGHQAFRP